MTRFSAAAAGIVSILALVAASPARGGDGVVEINQARALAGGVSPGDAPGFPVIVGCGSYRLTSDLEIPNGAGTGVGAVRVACDTGTTIDLNGFRIRGYADCAGMPLPGCSNGSGGPGQGAGVAGEAGMGRATSVRNGTISGMFGHGVDLPADAAVEDLASLANGGHGIVVGAGSGVSRVRVVDNVGTGIRAEVGGVLQRASVADARVQNNGGPGLVTVGLARDIVAIDNQPLEFQIQAEAVERCQAIGVSRSGVAARTVRRCTVQGDGLSGAWHGISAAVAEDNEVLAADQIGLTCALCRGNLVRAGFIGIKAVGMLGGGRGIVEGNIVVDSSAAGFCLDLPAGTPYRGNSISCASVSSGINLGGNICDGALCP